MSVVIDITGLPEEHVVFAPSPLAELSAALHVLSEPAHHPGLHGWTTTTLAGLEPDLAGRLAEADILWRSTRSDILLPGGPRPGGTLAEELDLVDRMEDERYVQAALEINCGGDYGDGGPSPLTDEGARRRALERAAARGPGQLDFVRHLLADPPAVRAWIRRLLEDCDRAFFADTWQRVRGQLAADARHKTELMRRRGLAESLAAASTAITLEEDGRGRRVVVDKLAQGRTTAVDPTVGPGLTLVPTAFGWPHLLVLHARGWRPVIEYPVASRELRAGPGSVELMQRRLEALAHPVRIRLCRSLARAPYTTGELADALGITAPEVSRHLKVLRGAGLLTTRRQGRYVQHQIDVTVVARLGSDFLEAVLR
ncbi:metalloregulator ArsR/SmtB family transcription factor [Streptomyces sp. TRM43335]|uniref:Metalloregulator ArsR/SmtB family transcription factor n=1 Tax=Streptomyces taklimakanensis TaxID=2569853 RepID=A0A6G2BEQ0_9ACTN|nr:DUF5937 family protein [Streptomyces taklimakanensis]MTE20382.1 metalloregulator ArsR/SmtB family transcription factor [Streptomyces taklimakanensis]